MKLFRRLVEEIRFRKTNMTVNLNDEIDKYQHIKETLMFFHCSRSFKDKKSNRRP